MRLAAGLVLLVACDDAATAEGGGAFVVADYFEGAEVWTWRDDGDTGDVVDADVLRGEMDDDGTLKVRRGPRFADGEPVGELQWGLTATDLVLESWEWGEADNGDTTIFARDGALTGDIVSNLEGACVAEAVDVLQTSYGIFDHALLSTCDGTAAPSGKWWFAKGFGVVRVETDTILLDFVAPR